MEWPLNTEEIETLRAALDRIVPEDDYPSATGLNCDEFVRRRMTDEPSLVPFYRTGLSLLGDKGFRNMTTPEQDATLQSLEGHPFLNLLIQHTMEGYYSDPGNGGNAGAKAWQMIGFEVRG